MCCSKGLIKRVLPFFLTFAVGLFIASFFVTVAAPNLRFPIRGERSRHLENDHLREAEIQRLNERIYQLENDLSLKQDLLYKEATTSESPYMHGESTAPFVVPVEPTRNARR